MNQLVGCFAKKRGQIRRLLSGFGREYFVNTAIRYSKFRPCLDSLTIFYNKLPDDRFDITTTLVEILNNEVKEKESIHHLPNNFNKYTYYYPFIDQILLLEAKHGMDAYKKICTKLSFHSHQIYTWRSLGANKTIHHFGRIFIILKLDIQYTKRSGMKRVIIPLHLANNMPPQKIQWVSTQKKYYQVWYFLDDLLVFYPQ